MVEWRNPELSAAFLEWTRDVVVRLRDVLGSEADPIQVGLILSAQWDLLSDAPTYPSLDRELRSVEADTARLNTMVGLANFKTTTDRAFVLLRFVRAVHDSPAELPLLEAFQEVYAEFEELLYGENSHFDLVLPVAGLELDADRVELGDGLALDVVPDELKRTWAGFVEFPPVAVIGTLKLSILVDNETDVADRDRITAMRARVASVIQALHVYKAGQCFTGDTYSSARNSFLGGGEASGPSRSMSLGRFDGMHFEPDEVRGFSAFFAAYDSDGLRRRPFISVAARRLQYSAERSRDEDRLTDLMIAAEALFLEESERQELSLRLSLRAAWYLADGADNRVEIYDLFRKAYGLRSKVVHGSQTDTQELRSTSNDVETYVRRALHVAVPAAASDAIPAKKLADWDSVLLDSR